ncbi:uncharacterized protein LAJ45_03289 [Morchella importuna]|uniref:uncharacterized protein n=1 Tax=Morchella importuna TaxID=1174673 RepID=UPI001E8E2291|nr:uncharacterized protein LAJ45_03289 [Morchella importuna]KAH8152449.1 hypothetical protein LAJ45_03289 [Morchella importuna]
MHPGSFDQSIPSRRTLASLTNNSNPPKPRRNPSERFDPKSIENGWYSYWTSRSLFEPQTPSAESKDKIRMLLPPPNVTGQLHIGHALMLSIQDALARYYRMNSHPVHWAPGTDHAGIATQSVVERMLKKKRGLSRNDLGRENFVKEVEKWRDEYGGRILGQVSRLGTSTTGSSEYYTLDKGLSEAVTNAFVRLYEEGLIYRDTRMVNWSVGLQTAISDIEVISEDVSKGTKIDGVEFGILHSFAFLLEDGSGEIVVSTTRPETIPGDRAVAVHPDDERYKHLHYKRVYHPLLPGMTLPIVPDAELVDPSFGTGAVKITPCHDINDYAFWQRHSLSYVSPSNKTQGKRVEIPLVPVFSSTGHYLPSSGISSLVGVDRLHARKSIVRLLEEAGVYRGRKDHDMRVGKCERSGCVIEPLLQPQWYLSTKPLAEKALAQSVSQGLIIRPETPYSDEWKRWLGVLEPGKFKERWIIATSEADAKSQLTEDERRRGCVLEQDSDVLDTWFSSGLLPLSTAGWRGNEMAEGHQEWKENYPLDFIESGGDILFFWLARMAMLCTWFSGKLPFGEILLHPLVCDARGRKMSKSVGNVLDPLAVVEGRTIDRIIQEIEADSKEEIELGKSLNTNAGEKQAKDAQTLVRNKIKEARKTFPQGITESGADPLRMALVDYTRQARQINMELRHIDAFRRLGIKIDNAFKFFHNFRKPSDKAFGTAIEGNIRTPATIKSWIEGLDKERVRLHDWYMLYHLRELVGVCNTAFEERKLYKATEAIRAFTFDVLCDVYLEFVKEELGDENRRDIAMGMMFHALDVTLRLTHPFMPFITEGLWQELDPKNRAEVDGTSIMLSTFPSASNFPDIEFSQAEPMKGVLELVESLRRFSHDVSSSPDKRSKKVVSILPPQDGSLTEYLKEKKETLARLSKVEIRTIFGETRWSGVEADLVGSADGWVELPQSIDGQDGVLVIGRRTNTQ